MKNALLVVKTDVRRHQAEVILPGEECVRQLYLLEMTGKTRLIEDLRVTYGEAITPFHEKLAKKLFGEEESINKYGVFWDDDLKLVFAFNRRFADYDPKTKTVVYKDLDDFLVAATATPVEPVDESPDNPAPFAPSHWPVHLPADAGGMMIRYSIPDPAAEQSVAE